MQEFGGRLQQETGKMHPPKSTQRMLQMRLELNRLKVGCYADVEVFTGLTFNLRIDPLERLLLFDVERDREER